MTTSNGGPAFPTGTGYQGMTLRDYFAAKALQGLLADPNAFEDTGLGIENEYAEQAYVYADAMLKARKM